MMLAGLQLAKQGDEHAKLTLDTWEEGSECETLGQLLKLIEHLLPNQVQLARELIEDLCRTDSVVTLSFKEDVGKDVNKILKNHADGSGGSSQPEEERPPTEAKSHKNSEVWWQSHLSFFPSAENGGFRERVFILFAEGQKSLCGRAVDAVMILAIVVSTIAFTMESMPQFRHRPAECSNRRTAEHCEPVPDDGFWYIEAVCIAIFSVDYIARISTVHAMPSLKSPVQNCLLRTLTYARQPLNTVDIVAIVPFYIGLIMEGRTSPLLRFLRLARVMRLFKVAKHHQGFAMFAEVLQMSGQPLLILVFANVILAVVFGSLIYFTEGMTYSVSPEFTEAGFPTGVYVRPTAGSSGGLGGGLEKADEVSPYRSIPYAVWWALVTMTTVGYGDYSPTSFIGKMIGVLCFYVGIVFLALPISVLGTNFEIAYGRRVQKKRPRRKTCYKVRTKIQDVHWLPTAEGVRCKLFVMLQDPSASRVGKIITIFVIIVILFSTSCFIMETMPSFRSTPDSCLSGPNATLSVDNCEPRSDPMFAVFEVTCIIIFTIEYVARVLLVHSVRPEDCGVELPPHVSHVSPLRLTWLYCLQPLNVLDLIVIVPFYMGLVVVSGSETSVLRVLRLVRIFRVLKMPKLRACADMFLSVVADALPALALMFFMTMLMCVLFGSLMFFAENSEYDVDYDTASYPWGVYIRPDAAGYGKEPSPFVSILYTFWWFFATATTVGYGDDYPTTTAGRCVGVMAFYTGIVLLALPITIVGGCFNTHYPNWVKEFEVCPDIDDIDQQRRQRCSTDEDRLDKVHDFSAAPPSTLRIDSPSTVSDNKPSKVSPIGDGQDPPAPPHTLRNGWTCKDDTICPPGSLGSGDDPPPPPMLLS